MRVALRPFFAATLALLAACGSITDPSGPDASDLTPTAKRHPQPPPPPPPAHTPILFVHGWNSSASVWTTMIGRFKTDGWQTSELASFSYNTSASNVTTAGIIAGKVDSIRTATGATQVVIIGHSMGTLSARYYIKNLGGDQKVAALVSLAGANHGTNTAIFCAQTACREMLPGSTFLTALNSGDETPGLLGYRTWWSPCDEVINPRDSALLDGATNTQTACLQHSQLHENATVYAQVRDWLPLPQPAPSAIVASAR
jgi:triacylglycerol lipase